MHPTVIMKPKPVASLHDIIEIYIRTDHRNIRTLINCRRVPTRSTTNVQHTITGLQRQPVNIDGDHR